MRIKKKTKKAFKVTLIIIIIIVLLLFILGLLFKPVYEVRYKDEFMGYTKKLINVDEEVENELKKGGDGISYYDLEEPIVYNIKLMKLGSDLNYDIVESIKDVAVPVYRYYTVVDGSEEVGFFKTYSEASDAVGRLTEIDEEASEDVTISISYIREQKEYTDGEKLANDIHEKQVALKEKKKNEFHRSPSAYTGVSYKGISYSRRSLPIKLSAPIKGPITSRFQPARTVFGRTSPHSGIDIGRDIGTPVVAAQSGYVTVSGVHGSYGNFICIDHSKNVVTGYAHLSKRIVSIGDFVEQGEVIGYVGSTGRSTGSHLHFEVRIEGVAHNPEYYVSFN